MNWIVKPSCVLQFIHSREKKINCSKGVPKYQFNVTFFVYCVPIYSKIFLQLHTIVMIPDFLVWKTHPCYTTHSTTSLHISWFFMMILTYVFIARKCVLCVCMKTLFMKNVRIFLANFIFVSWFQIRNNRKC